MIESKEEGVMIKGRGISKGKTKGTVIKSVSPLSLADDLSSETSEVLKSESEIHTQLIKDKVLVFPSSPPTKDYLDPLSKLKSKGLHPRALVAGSLDTDISQDVIDSAIPAVDGIDISLLESDDHVEINGTDGFVTLKQVVLKNVATSVLSDDGKVLILRRSKKVGTYKGRWACISGYVEEGERPEDTAWREVMEEIGLERNDFELIRKAEVLYARDRGTIWGVHPFHFHVKKAEIELDWEHIEYKWITPMDIVKYATVPKLKETIERALMDPRDD